MNAERRPILSSFCIHRSSFIVSHETPPNVARRILASDLRRRVLVFPTPEKCGGLRRASSPYFRPGHDLGPFFAGFRQITRLTPLPRSSAEWRKLQQLPPRGDLGEVGHLGLARAAKIIGGQRTFRKIPQSKNPPITTQRLPNVSATSTFESEKVLNSPIFTRQAVGAQPFDCMYYNHITRINGPRRDGDLSPLLPSCSKV